MTLAAVPTPRRTPELAHREQQFRRLALRAIEEQSGPEAADSIAHLYMADMGATDVRREAAESEATAAANDARARYDMMQQAHSNASHGLLTIAQQAAEISALRAVVSNARRLAERADNGAVPQSNLLAVLEREPSAAVYVATVTGFAPSSRFRSGLFTTPDGSVQITLPFVGYSLVDHGPSAAGIIETTFLMDTRTLPQSAIEAQAGMQLQQMMPRAPLPAAS